MWTPSTTPTPWPPAPPGRASVHADVFTRLPGQGTWSHALLADGNLGIGGDPAALLGRAAALVAHRGTVLVELDPAEPGLWRGEARVRSRHAVTPSFPWACAGPTALPDLAARAGLRRSAYYRGVRQFVELTRDGCRAGADRAGAATPRYPISRVRRPA